ncbi:hypothetical protein RMN57_30395 [Kitasatospora sp. CM 4170]|uniref:Tetratricopeptide repeat protein n=1 Tax=Kitasatospora aburaviensis TaxID=67265 RepID=A0ABW1ERL7_9ACTN|nr:hypothetical protein [Kitasatospora sp. CM 4170]WNM48699.1 hypothetical protein RMN57_30395 [Kitasatospora sp. CM 4170]
MAETTAVPGGPDPVADAVPRDAVPPGPRNPYDEHLPGPAALYDPPTPPPAVPPAAPPMPPTGWTVTGMPAVDLPPSATPPPFTVPGATPAHGISAAPGAGPGGLGTAPRGRILVVEGGYGTSGRRTWGRGGPTQAPVLSAMLAAVSPQVLLAADAVDAVHLPGASDPHTVLAHLRAAARHPGPLLVHLGGHLLADKRGGQLHLTLRDSKPGSVRQDGLAWQSIAGELRHRPAEWQTLVIADLSADQNALPFLQGTISPLADGLPLWAVVSPDPEQIGTFTRALIEALHGGRPGAEAVLAPEQLRHQVYSVLRPDVVILATHAPNRPFFRNTARRTDGSQLDPVPYEGPRPAAVLPRPPAARDAAPRDAVPRDGVPADRPAVTLDKPAAAGVTGGAAPVPAAPPVPPTAPAPVPAPVAAPAPAPVVPEGPVDLLKAAVPATPPPPAQPVDLVKPYAWRPTLTDGIRLGKPAPADAVPQDAAPADAVPADAVPKDAVPQDAVPADAVPKDAGRDDEAPVSETPAAEAATEAVPAEEGSAGENAAAPAPVGAAPADVAPAEAPPAGADASRRPRADYPEVIGRIVRSADAGDHAAATDLAFALELEAIAEHGTVSEPVLQVRQVRAHVCRLAGRTAEAADIYREVALTLLRSQGPEHPETQRAATNAEACWRAIPDRAEAIRIAPEIIELRAHLPGTDNRKLRAAERHLANLAAQGA